MSGAIGGLIVGVIAWLSMAKSYYGELTVTTTGSSYPTLAGNMAGVLTGLILTTVVSYIKPDDFDWAVTRSINLPEITATPSTPHSSGEETLATGSDEDKKTTTHTGPGVNHALPTVLDEEKEALEDAAILEDPTRLKGALMFAYISATILTLLMCFIIPIPMFLSHYIFSVGFFKGWVAISFIWVFFALFSCAILPIYEAAGFFRAFWKETMEFEKKNKK
jgi:hypothetical protein